MPTLFQKRVPHCRRKRPVLVKHLKCLPDPSFLFQCLIAAQALRMGATMVTANVSEFRRVDGLSWQDWTNAA
jgi:predicted nucleic acid-binding protein